jgi:3-oxocholest-4-en-26-oate---CoA ligase
LGGPRERGGGATPGGQADIQTHCRTKIAGYKVPRELHLVDKIERSPSGKPDYRWAKDVALETSPA